VVLCVSVVELLKKTLTTEIALRTTARLRPQPKLERADLQLREEPNVYR